MTVRFSGYASVFDRIDRGGDIVRGGAYATLPVAVPLLWQHSGAPIGAIEQIGSDQHGLRVIGRVDDPGLARLVRAGAIHGLSVGYRVRAARRDQAAGHVRELTALDLVEISLVAEPMQPSARILALYDYQQGE